MVFSTSQLNKILSVVFIYIIVMANSKSVGKKSKDNNSSKAVQKSVLKKKQSSKKISSENRDLVNVNVL